VKAKRTDPARAKLENELKKAIREVDEEGLLFLLRQAQTLIYNARVERINQEAEKLKGAKKTAGGKESPPQEARQSVLIEESDGGKTIFLTIGKARKVLTPEEMRRIVRICYGAETKSEALRQLFTVLARERRDILADAIIGNPDNPLLEALFTVVRQTYTLKER
jgi:lipoprotein-anchoring transpeptidase ErfK/SrfK